MWFDMQKLSKIAGKNGGGIGGRERGREHAFGNRQNAPKTISSFGIRLKNANLLTKAGQEIRYHVFTIQVKLMITK